MRILAIDYGGARVGLAVSDPGRSFAFPLRTLPAGAGLIDAIAGVCGAEEVGEIVVGFPRTLAGHVGPQAATVERFVEELRRAVTVPIAFEDERFSTAFAERELAASSARADHDSAAAAAILESYLTRIAHAEHAQCYNFE